MWNIIWEQLLLFRIYNSKVIFVVCEKKIKIIFKVENTEKEYTIITMHHSSPSKIFLYNFFNSVKQNQK